MKHHVLLGLLLGLLATAKLGGQVLFNVTFDPSIGEITISAAQGATAQIPTDKFQTTGNVPTTLNTFDGLTFTNFFTNGFSSQDQGPAASNNPGITAARGEESALFSSHDFTSVDQVTLATIQAPISNAPESFVNSGRNLNLFAGSAMLFQGSTAISFSGAFVFNVGAPELQLPSLLTDGPRSIYAGYNNAYNGDSFLGTYTITVVPEPSTYAAIAGGLGLLAAVLHRRRQRSRASAA